MMEAKLRQMANSSHFGERPALPSKPVAPQKHGAQSRRALSRGAWLASDEIDREGGQDTHGRLAALPSIRHADTMETLPSSKQRSIPGVKIVKGASNKGTPGITLSI